MLGPLTPDGGAFALHLETDKGDIEINVPTDRITGLLHALFQAARLADQNKFVPAPGPGDSIEAASLLVHSLAGKVLTPEHAMLLARSGVTTVALHLHPVLLSEAATEILDMASDLRTSSKHRH
jgi:hypothetical protein